MLKLSLFSLLLYSHWELPFPNSLARRPPGCFDESGGTSRSLVTGERSKPVGLRSLHRPTPRLPAAPLWALCSPSILRTCPCLGNTGSHGCLGFGNASSSLSSSSLEVVASACPGSSLEYSFILSFPWLLGFSVISITRFLYSARSAWVSWVVLLFLWINPYRQRKKYDLCGSTVA